MGVIAPLDFIDMQIMNSIRSDIIVPTLKGIQSEYLDYKGFIYFGIMLTANGPRLLEYNVRMGDPEACVLLPSLKNCLYEIIEATLNGKLKNQKFEFHDGFFSDVVLVSEGYPGKYSKGSKIEIGPISDHNTLIFHAGTKKLPDGQIVTNGGRVLNVVSSEKTLSSAVTNAYKATKSIIFEGMSKRCDIGRRGKKKLAILISGRGSNMEAIIKNCLNEDGILSEFAFPSVVISNHPNAQGIQIAQKYGIDAVIIDSEGKKRQIFEQAIIKALEPYSVDLVVLAGFDRILTSCFISKYKNKIINIHPADTSLFKGLNGYKWAYEKKLQETCITVHFVDEEVDAGEVILKEKVDLKNAKSLEEIEKIGLENEHIIYSQAIRSLIR